ncbi:MAG: endonuclease/exonuclease/phosphatase family protein [Opitutales bacterium]
MLGLLIFKRKLLATLLAALWAANAVAVFPHVALTPRDDVAPKQATSALLINVNTRLGSPEKVSAYIREKKPDFFVLQEVNDDWITLLSSLIATFPHQVVRTREDNFGLGLFSRHPIVNQFVGNLGDSSVPYIDAELIIETKHLRVITAHTLPPTSSDYSKVRNHQLIELANISAQREKPLVLLGDLNVTSFSWHFENFISSSGLIDSSEMFGLSPSWPSFLPMMRIQIDHLLHTEDIEIHQKITGPRVGSDHYPIFTTFTINGD